MVPLADMINHDSEPNAWWGSYTADRLTALRDLKPGEEIMISYGEYSNPEKWLDAYGFIPPDALVYQDLSWVKEFGFDKLAIGMSLLLMAGAAARFGRHAYGQELKDKACTSKTKKRY